MIVFVHIAEIYFFILHKYPPLDFLIHISVHPHSFILFFHCSPLPFALFSLFGVLFFLLLITYPLGILTVPLFSQIRFFPRFPV